MYENVICSTVFTCSLICVIAATKVHALQYYVENVDIDLDQWNNQRNTPSTQIRTEDLNCVKSSVYICEVPPNAVASNEAKTCNYRNINYHEQLYRWVAGLGCLQFMPNFLFVAGVNIFLTWNTACRYGNRYAPCLEVAKDDGTCGCFPFDPGFPDMVAAVNQLLVPSVHGRWQRCFTAAADCCTLYMLQSHETEGEGCPATYDGWTCWQSAEAGSVATEICSEFAYSGQGPSCHHYSSKTCYANSTWESQTDYSTCSIAPRLLTRYNFHIAVLAFSIASSLPAVFVFFFYKRLRITRVALHRNLLIAIIIRNVLVIVGRSEVYIDELTNTKNTTLSENGVPCRVLAVAEKIAGNAVFTFMLIEGIYLHRLIVAVFRQKLNIKWLYVAGAVIAVAPAVAWTVVMQVTNNHSCWVVYTVPHIQWILDAPRVLILIINTILFADVLRILLTKIRNSENINQLNTAKATLFLMPIFGTQFLLTAFRPTTTNCIGEQAYYFIAYTVEGAQGFLVAMIYCYVNKEVRTLVKATYRKTETAISRSRDSVRPQMQPALDRRITFSTGLSSNNDSCSPKEEIKADKTKKDKESTPVNLRPSTALDPVIEIVENGISNDGYMSDDCEDSRKDNKPPAVEAINPLDFQDWTNSDNSRVPIITKL